MDTLSRMTAACTVTPEEALKLLQVAAGRHRYIGINPMPGPFELSVFPTGCHIDSDGKLVLELENDGKVLLSVQPYSWELRRDIDGSGTQAEMTWWSLYPQIGTHSYGFVSLGFNFSVETILPGIVERLVIKPAVDI